MKSFKQFTKVEETTEPKWKKQMRDQKARYAAGERPDTKAHDKAFKKNAKLARRRNTEQVNEAKGKLVKNMRVQHVHNGNTGVVIKGGDRAGGRVEVEWDNGNTTVVAGKYLEPIKKSAKKESVFETNITEALDPEAYESQASKKGSLFLGRMQPIHNGHDAIIKMLKHTPFVVIVKGAKSSQDKARNPFDFGYQSQLVKMLNPKVDVSEAPTGYIPDMINNFRKQGVEIVEVLAGADRISGYKRQIDGFNKQMPEDKQINVTIKETPRITSATDVRNAISAGDEETFKKLVPKKLWKEFDKMKKIMS